MRYKRVSKQELLAASAAVCEKLYATVDWKTVRRLHCYGAHQPWHEIDPSSLLQRLQREHPWINISIAGHDLVTSPPRDKFDLIIVPLVGYDGTNRRLGRGGGWYDRFLAEQKQALTIGLAHKFAELEAVPVEPHDVLLDRIVSA